MRDPRTAEDKQGNLRTLPHVQGRRMQSYVRYTRKSCTTVKVKTENGEATFEADLHDETKRFDLDQMVGLRRAGFYVYKISSRLEMEQ
jgi:hypothetical protein